MAALTHKQIWDGIDGLATRHSLSPSGLAKLAGLDPTTFNKSKRADAGKLRWPSTESIAKVLHATGSDRKSTRLNSSHIQKSRMPSSA